MAQYKTNKFFTYEKQSSLIFLILKIVLELLKPKESEVISHTFCKTLEK